MEIKNRICKSSIESRSGKSQVDGHTVYCITDSRQQSERWCRLEKGNSFRAELSRASDDFKEYCRMKTPLNVIAFIINRCGIELISTLFNGWTMNQISE